MTSLAQGQSSYVQVSVTGNNGLTTNRNSSLFTIQGSSPDVVYYEVEPNNSWYQANVVSHFYNVIRGTQPAGFIWDDDFFAVEVPAGKDLCLAAARTNSSTCPGRVALHAWIPGLETAFPLGGAALKPYRASITFADYICGHPYVGQNYLYV